MTNKKQLFCASKENMGITVVCLYHQNTGFYPFSAPGTSWWFKNRFYSLMPWVITIWHYVSKIISTFAGMLSGRRVIRFSYPSSILFFGSQPFTAIIVQIFLNLLSIILLYKIGIELFSEKSRFYCSCFIFHRFTSHHFYLLHFNGNDLHYRFLAALLFYVKAIKIISTLNFFILTGLIYGISTLIRPISQYYIGGIFSVYLIMVFQRMEKRHQVLGYVNDRIFCGDSSWCYRNYSEYGHFALSNIKGYNLLFWNASYYESKTTASAR